MKMLLVISTILCSVLTTHMIVSANMTNFEIITFKSVETDFEEYQHEFTIKKNVDFFELGDLRQKIYEARKREIISKIRENKKIIQASKLVIPKKVPSQIVVKKKILVPPKKTAKLNYLSIQNNNNGQIDGRDKFFHYGYKIEITEPVKFYTIVERIQYPKEVTLSKIATAEPLITQPKVTATKESAVKTFAVELEVKKPEKQSPGLVETQITHLDSNMGHELPAVSAVAPQAVVKSKTKPSTSPRPSIKELAKEYLAKIETKNVSKPKAFDDKMNEHYREMFKDLGETNNRKTKEGSLVAELDTQKSEYSPRISSDLEQVVVEKKDQIENYGIISLDSHPNILKQPALVKNFKVAKIADARKQTKNVAPASIVKKATSDALKSKTDLPNAVQKSQSDNAQLSATLLANGSQGIQAFDLMDAYKNADSRSKTLQMVYVNLNDQTEEPAVFNISFLDDLDDDYDSNSFGEVEFNSNTLTKKSSFMRAFQIRDGEHNLISGKMNSLKKNQKIPFIENQGRQSIVLSLDLIGQVEEISLETNSRYKTMYLTNEYKITEEASEAKFVVFGDVSAGFNTVYFASKFGDIFYDIFVEQDSQYFESISFSSRSSLLYLFQKDLLSEDVPLLDISSQNVLPELLHKKSKKKAANVYQIENWQTINEKRVVDVFDIYQADKEIKLNTYEDGPYVIPTSDLLDEYLYKIDARLNGKSCVIQLDLEGQKVVDKIHYSGLTEIVSKDKVSTAPMNVRMYALDKDGEIYPELGDETVKVFLVGEGSGRIDLNLEHAEEVNTYRSYQCDGFYSIDSL